MKIIIAIALLVVISLWFGKAYGFISAPDTQCTQSHETKSTPPENTITAQDYFNMGNYQYDIGDCIQAVVSYTQAVQLDPNFSRAYNNKAYTEMRMHKYNAALGDLNSALAIDPDYVTALMNRGDIHNYYYAIDRQKAIADYNRVIELGKNKDMSGSVCGHKAMAQTNNMIPLAFMKIVTHTDCTSTN